MKTTNLMILSAALLLSAALAAQDNMVVRPATMLEREGPVLATLELGTNRAEHGEVFEASVRIADGARSLSSYALRVEYDPAVLSIADISGGLVSAFSSMPLSDSSSFQTGITDFTAVSDDGSDTPEEYQVARIRFQVVGNVGAYTDVKLSNSTGGGMVDAASYELLAARFALPERFLVTGLPVTGERQ